jgi:hypothetical protein
MTCRRGLLVVILVYVALDLSLPTMPGAFVFEPADSVESIGGGRPTARVVVLPVPAAGSSQIAPRLRSDLRHRLPPRSEVAPLGRPPGHRPPRVIGDPSQSSEDPH